MDCFIGLDIGTSSVKGMLLSEKAIVKTASREYPLYYPKDEFDMTILLIEHDMKFVSGLCDEITVLNFGTVLAQGKTEEALSDPEVIKAYIGE